MLCGKPFRQGVEEFGCGQCLPCRINRRRIWAGRLILESRLHAMSLFVTLTYSDDHLPTDGVRVRDVQLFLKRLRRRTNGHVRYYAVGEYGDFTNRAHYHLVLYGVAGVGHVRSSKKNPFAWKTCPCVVCSSWRKGGVHLGKLTEKSAQYMCSYVVKGATRKGDSRLAGCAPEFARMSLRPGIGAGSTAFMAEALTDMFTGEIRSAGDVPSRVRFGDGMVPLGRYLKEKLSEKVGSSVVLEYLRALRLVDASKRLRALQAREERERRRRAHQHKAAALYQISRSRKGVGL